MWIFLKKTEKKCKKSEKSFAFLKKSVIFAIQKQRKIFKKIFKAMSKFKSVKIKIMEKTKNNPAQIIWNMDLSKMFK